MVQNAPEQGRRRRLAAAVSALAATMAFAGLGGGAAAAAEPQSQVQPQTYVAMGDSFSAGPLILPQSELLTCARSAVNYPALMAERLKVDTSRFRDVTCSSARTENFAGPQPGNVSGTAAPQYDALSEDTTLVTVGVGGNDIGLVGLVQACTNFLPDGPSCKDTFTKGGIDQYAQKIDTFAPTYGTVIEEIRDRAPKARILMVGYPTGFKPGGCHPYVPLLGKDADYIQANMDRLNRRMAEQADLHGATYVDLRTPSTGHDACQPAGTKWIEGLFPSLTNNGFTPFHPNAEGMRNAVPTVAEAYATATAPTEPTGGPPKLKMLTYNAFLFSKTLYPNWGQDHRAKALPAASFYQGNDVVVVQEAFDNTASDALKSNSEAQYPYQTPVLGRGTSGWDTTHGAYSSLTPEDGGVAVLSKWPILRQEQYVYKEACGADRYANKGFVYAVLNVNGAKVHVVGTHAQATDPTCDAGEPARIRSTQFKEMDAFLDAKNIPAGEQVIVAGDFNVDSHSAEYTTILTAGDFADAPRTGHPYSFDTKDNSIASERYPTDPREDLDYILHRAGHAQPAGWTNEVVKEQSAPWSVTSWGTTYTYTNLSDHYPVVAGR